MQHTSTATGASRKVHGTSETEGDDKKVLPTGGQRCDDEAVEDHEELRVPPAKKCRYGQSSSTPKPEGAPVDKKRKKPNKSASKDDESSSKRPKKELPKQEKTLLIYNSKFKIANSYGLYNDDAGTSRGARAMPQAETGEGAGGATNNNELTEQAGGSGNKRRGQKKRHSKADQDSGLAKKVRREVEMAEKDSGVGSLVDLMDVMAVGEKKKPTATVTSKSNVFDLMEVVQWTRDHWDQECRKAATKTALRSTVVVDGIPRPMLQFIDSKIKEFFASCGHMLHYSTHEFMLVNNCTFSATVHFESEDAASKALQKDRALLGGVRVRVRRPGPVEWTLDGHANTASRRVEPRHWGLSRPRRSDLGLSLEDGELFYLPESRAEEPVYGHRFARPETPDSD